MPPNLNKVGHAAFYPKTEKGYIYAKNGINPMFKVINKKGAIYPKDKHYFQLDVSKIIPDERTSEGDGNGFTKARGMPTQIYPIESFEFVNKNSSYDKFQWTDPKDPTKIIFSTPPFPLNLLSNTNYLKFYVSEYNVERIKKDITYVPSDNTNIIGVDGENYVFPQLYFPFGKSTAIDAPLISYLDPVTNNELMPAIVSHPYLFKYILATICSNQMTRKYQDASSRFVYEKSNDIFSMHGNQITISFINQFTEGTKGQEVIDLRLDQDAIIQILNYDFTSKANDTSSLNPKDVEMLEKWNKEYGMLDNYW